MKRLVNRLSGACLYVLLALVVGMSSCEDDANDWAHMGFECFVKLLDFNMAL